MAKIIQLKDENGVDLYPKADIYDTGTNTNGSWIRYTNGIARCWKKWTITGVGINSLIKTDLYRCGTQNPGSLPITLTTVDYYNTVACVTYTSEVGMSWSQVNGEATTTTYASFVIFSPSSSTGRAVTYCAEVIGRWK